MAKEIPILERKTTIQVPEMPNVQGAYEEAANSNNLLSTIGSTVAQTASNQIAAQLGYEAGKNPTGKDYPSFTEFDKNFNDSYHTQAAATLSLQGQKLLDDAHIEMSKAPRLTPQLIDNTQKQLQIGLNKIAENAPLAVKGKLQQAFDAHILNQTTQYKEKMFSQQREDQKDNLVNAIDFNTKSVFEISSSGNLKAAEEAVKNIEYMADNGVVNKFYTPEEARKIKETARQTYLDGKYTYIAQVAKNTGNFESFAKNFVDHQPSDIKSHEQWTNTGQAILRQGKFLDSMKAQDENLRSQQMLNVIATNPGAITDTKWMDFAKSVSPLKAEQVKFHLVQALKKNQSETTSVDTLIKGYDDPVVQANADPKVKNASFNKLVDYVQSKGQKNNIPVSRDQAEVQVASHAGAEIPVFTNSLKNKLSSANPNVIESGALQIHSLLQNGNGQALKGLNEQDWAMFAAYENLRDSPDPIKAAQDAHNRIYNQDPEVEKLNKQKWASVLTKQNSAGITNDNFALKTFGMNKDDFINPTIASAYGLNILGKFSNFFSITGDYEQAKRATQRWVDDNYGDTYVNGSKYKTLHPIEKKLGFKSRDGVPYIQQDAVNQFNEQLKPLKAAYDAKTLNEYWEVHPVLTHGQESKEVSTPKNPFKMEGQGKTAFETMRSALIREKEHFTPATEGPSKTHGLIFKSYDPIKITRHMRTANGEKKDTFNVILIGNTFDNYDIAIETKEGMRNLYKEFPMSGLMSYTPNQKAILESYNRDLKLK